MTIRFASANPYHNPAIARLLAARVPLRAANDNLIGIGEDELLRAALRHFAEHGLGAANHARALAEDAFFKGDRTEYRWWLAICRALDRRMAEAVAARVGTLVDRADEPPTAGTLS